ncbi:MAG: LuxR C-terminal-related transcriptional regulator, partial [Thermomicrobiales bacterium]
PFIMEMPRDERTVSLARAALGEAHYRHEFAAGRGLSIADAARQALAAAALIDARTTLETIAGPEPADAVTAASAGRGLAPAPETAESPDVGEGSATSITEFPVRSAVPVPIDLTRREREVLHLLCQRLTDPEIAERLFLSPRTASNHVGSIIDKVGAENRREAAAIAARLGLC